MKPVHFIFMVLLLGIVSCKNRRATITVYESFCEKDILPALSMIDLASDTSGARQLLAAQNYLTGVSSDTLTLNINTYLRSGYQNSLFRYLAPNLNRYNKNGAAVFANSPILGSSFIGDTQMVIKILSSKFNERGIYFMWVPNGSVIIEDSIHQGKPRQRQMGLIALKAGLAPMKFFDVEVKPIHSEPRLLDSVLSTAWEPRRYKYVVAFDKATKTMMKSKFAKDETLLLDCVMNDEHYYFVGTAEEIAAGRVPIYQ